MPPSLHEVFDGEHLSSSSASSIFALHIPATLRPLDPWQQQPELTATLAVTWEEEIAGAEEEDLDSPGGFCPVASEVEEGQEYLLGEGTGICRKRSSPGVLQGRAGEAAVP